MRAKIASDNNMDVDVGLNKCSKQWKGKLGTEVQSVEGVVEWKRAKGVLKVLAIDQTSS